MDNADEIIDSLALGDHVSLNRPATRGLIGIGVLAAGMLRSSPRVKIGDPDVIHIVANPVAHGSRLSEAVMDSLRGMNVARVADARIAEITPDVNVAGLGARSMLSVVTRQRVVAAVHARLAVPATTIKRISTSRLYSEYLFLAQHIRYAVAAEALEGVSDRTVILTDFDRAAYSRPWVRAANERKMQTATMVHGSPNQNYIPVLAHTVLAWGQVQADWFAMHSPGTVVQIVGRPDIAEDPAPKPNSYITMDDVHRIAAGD